MLKEIIIAIQSYAEAHRFIVKHRLWKWILVTGIVYAALFFASLYFFWITSKGVIDYALNATGVTNWLLQFKESFLGLIIVIITYRCPADLILFLFLAIQIYFSYRWVTAICLPE